MLNEFALAFQFTQVIIHLVFLLLFRSFNFHETKPIRIINNTVRTCTSGKPLSQMGKVGRDNLNLIPPLCSVGGCKSSCRISSSYRNQVGDDGFSFHCIKSDSNEIKFIKNIL